MKQILTIITVAVLFATSCNNAPKTDEAKTAAPAASTSLSPYKARMISFTVADFDKWYSAFSSHDSLFKAYGMTDPGVAGVLDNDKRVMVFSTIADVAKSKEYDNLPGRKEMMDASGISDATAPGYWNVIMDDTSSIPQKERLMVTHHVKDYDVWKKVFDGEGMAARKANGFYERAIARNMDDANQVSIIFAITDMDKLKARMASPDMKKMMQDAGVDGDPQITFFKWVNM